MKNHHHHSGNALVLPLLVTLAGVMGSADMSFGQQVRRPRAVPQFPVEGLPKASATAAPPFTLTPQQQQRIDKILALWERNTSRIQRFTCTFHRFEYQPQWLPGVARTISDGQIRFQAPDKGEFLVTKYRECVNQGPNGNPRYEERSTEHSEHWACDGSTIFEFDPRQKLLIERILPPEWRGKAITDGPLPFLFGAKAERMKQRYWIREVVPSARKNEIQLEIIPNRAEDAVNYKKVHVMLAAGSNESDFLPNGMILYLHGDGEKKVFLFENRKINPRFTFKEWIGQGGQFRPKTPTGWKRVVDNGQPAGGAGGKSRIVEQPQRKRRRLLSR